MGRDHRTVDAVFVLSKRRTTRATRHARGRRRQRAGGRAGGERERGRHAVRVAARHDAYRHDAYERAWMPTVSPRVPRETAKSTLIQRSHSETRGEKEVEIGEPDLAPQKRPRRETSCSQAHAEVEHVILYSAAHAHDDLCPEAATSHCCEAGGDRTDVSMQSMTFPSMLWHPEARPAGDCDRRRGRRRRLSHRHATPQNADRQHGAGRPHRSSLARFRGEPACRRAAWRA